uniref:Uncharacterized protein n=1 Tax=Syphacia muris TaxID=451379 RepID=A0A0N5AC60_9BILA
MAQSKIESSDKADEVRMQMLQAKYDDLVLELGKKQTEFDETVRGLQGDLTSLEKENASLRQASKHVCKKTLLMNLSNSMTQNSVSSVPSTPAGVNGANAASYLAEIEYLESELVDKQQTIKYAESRIRHLKTRIIELEMRNLHPVELPNAVCGPLTLVSATNDQNKRTIDGLIKEAELLFLEANKFQVPYIGDFTKSAEARKAELRLRSLHVNEINRQIEDLKQRVRKVFAKLYANDQPSYMKTQVCKDTFKNTVVEDDQNIKQGTIEAARGIKSEKFKRAYSNLFGNLEIERRALEQRQLTAVAAC